MGKHRLRRLRVPVLGFLKNLVSWVSLHWDLHDVGGQEDHKLRKYARPVGLS